MHTVKLSLPNKKQHLWVLLFILMPFFAQASSLLEQQPYLKTEWFKINYYEPTKNGFKSEIINDEFFLSPAGPTNPEAELSAFIKLLTNYKNTPQKYQTTLCKFPARTTLLTPYLDWFSEENHPTCSDFKTQNNLDNVTSISLLFASGYFGSPSSYFGHNLLKVNYADTVLNQKTLNSSLNYGAEVQDTSSSPLYFINGLGGGYDASYQRNNNFIHSHNYTNGQLRDVWAYKLNLTQKQIRFILEHSWELKNARFSYYFLTDNCAHRIIKLIEMATDKTLSKTQGGWLMPRQTIYYAYKEGLIQSEEYNLSLKNQFETLLSTLSPAQKKQLKLFIHSSSPQKKEILKQSDTKTLFTLLMHLDIQVAKLSIKHSEPSTFKYLQKQRAFILEHLLTKPERDVIQPRPLSNTSYTLLNQPPMSVAWFSPTIRGGTPLLSVRYQITHNDLLTPPLPHQSPSRFIMGAGEVDLTHHRASVRKLTFLDILNLNTSTLNTSWLDSVSWGLSIDYAPQSESCLNCSTFGIKGLLGKSIKLKENTYAYALIGGRLNHQKLKEYSMATLNSESGILFHLTPKTRAKIGVDTLSNITNTTLRTTTKLELSKDFSQTRNLRLYGEVDHKQNSAIMLKYGIRFN